MADELRWSIAASTGLNVLFIGFADIKGIGLGSVGKLENLGTRILIARGILK